jgi:hypothetical protein
LNVVARDIFEECMQVDLFSMRPAMDETGKVVALVPEAVEITARVRAEQVFAPMAQSACR